MLWLRILDLGRGFGLGVSREGGTRRESIMLTSHPKHYNLNALKL